MDIDATVRTGPVIRILPAIAAARLRARDGWDSNANLRRAVQLAEHMGERSEITVAEALDVLHPGGTATAKNKTLQRIVDSVRADDADVELEVFGAKQLSGQRRLGFTARQAAGSEPRLVELGTVGAKFVDGQTATVRRDGKPLVRIFLSYNAKDETRAAELWNRLREFASIDRKYRFEFWDFKTSSLLPGDDWHRQVLAAVERGDLGIFAVSRHFLASNYIHEYELPDFVARNAAIPALLETLDLDKVDTKGLEGRQLFRHRGRAFDGMRGEREKNAWVEALRDAIHQILESRAQPADTPEVIPGARAHLTDLDSVPYLTRVFGRPGRLPGAPETAVATDGSQVDAVEYLVDWARRRRTPLAAVLGEYGTGKTITCQALMRELQHRREQGETDLPEPLYFDLRNVSGLRHRERVPTLHQILDECIERGWSPGESGRPRAQDLLERAKQTPLLFIIDGLDEALVHLTGSDGIVFTRELLSLRPPGGDGDPVAGTDTKVLLSCRTHYFRTVAEQYGQFLGQHRELADSDDFEALLLLPFAEEQIRTYLAKAVPDRDSGQLFEMLSSLHDLNDLTRRPVTLKLVVQQISFIEQRRAAGRPVHAADVYQRVVEAWLDRDKGKEHVRATDKLSLTAQLAAWMWQKNSRTVDLGDIEDWLHEQLDENPALRRRYGRLEPELLEEDLRTAAFLVRQDSADGLQTQGFRFAHTSFQEYFLARYLLEAVEQDRPDDWAIRPSDEALDFLGQLFDSHTDCAALLSTLGTWLTSYRTRVSELVLQFSLLADQQGWPRPDLRRMNLSGASLRDWSLRGSERRPLDLSGARLTGADLRSARLDFVDLGHADLTSARMDRAVLHRCRLANAEFAQASLVGAFLHYCDTDTVDFTGANLRSIRCAGAREIVPDLPVMERTELVVPNAHSAGVDSVAWTCDGTRLLTGSSFDGAVKVWQADSGQQLMTLAEPLRIARDAKALAASPDGTRFLLLRADGRVEVYDIRTGERLLTITDRTSVAAMAWSPDSSRVLTGGASLTATVWDARSGERLLVLEGHRGGVSAVAWSPDGSRLLTGSSDCTARIWDAHTGGHSVELTSDNEKIHAVTWSPDSEQVAIGGSRGRVTVWNSATGTQVATFTGGNKMWSLAWSPDGDRLLACVDDHAVMVWDIRNGSRLEVLTTDSQAAAWSPDSTRLLTGGAAGITEVVRDVNGSNLFRLSGTSSATWVYSVAWSPNGTRLAVANVQGTTIWEADTGRYLHALADESRFGTHVAWSPDSTRLITGYETHPARVWDADTGAYLHTLADHAESASTATWSPDGSRVVTGSISEALQVWDAIDGQLLHTFSDELREDWTIAWSPDSTRILGGSRSGIVQVWDADGNELRTLTDHVGDVAAVAWSPDGTRVVTCNYRGSMWVWDAWTGEQLLNFAGHERGTNTVSWSPDGTRLLSGGSDWTARIWDADRGEELLLLAGHTDSVQSVAWSPDGTRLVTGSGDGTARVWNSASGEEILCIAILTQDEFASWSPADNQLRYASPDAWRHLYARCYDTEGHIIGLQPYERYYCPEPG